VREQELQTFYAMMTSDLIKYKFSNKHLDYSFSHLICFSFTLCVSNDEINYLLCRQERVLNWSMNQQSEMKNIPWLRFRGEKEGGISCGEQEVTSLLCNDDIGTNKIQVFFNKHLSCYFLHPICFSLVLFFSFKNTYCSDYIISTFVSD